MPEILLFVKDFELGSRLSSACVDKGKNVEFSTGTKRSFFFICSRVITSLGANGSREIVSSFSRMRCSVSALSSLSF